MNLNLKNLNLLIPLLLSYLFLGTSCKSKLTTKVAENSRTQGEKQSAPPPEEENPQELEIPATPQPELDPDYAGPILTGDQIIKSMGGYSLTITDSESQENVLFRYALADADSLATQDFEKLVNIAVTESLADGEHIIYAQALSDLRISQVSSFTFTLDSTAPNFELSEDINGKGLGETQLQISGTCEAESSGTISGDILNSEKTIACANGTFNYAIEFTSSIGNKTITLAFADNLGNSQNKTYNLTLQPTLGLYLGYIGPILEIDRGQRNITIRNVESGAPFSFNIAEEGEVATIESCSGMTFPNYVSSNSISLETFASLVDQNLTFTCTTSYGDVEFTLITKANSHRYASASLLQGWNGIENDVYNTFYWGKHHNLIAYRGPHYKYHIGKLDISSGYVEPISYTNSNELFSIKTSGLYARVSENGRYIGFRSDTKDIVPGLGDGWTDYSYVWDTENNSFFLLNSKDGTIGNLYNNNTIIPSGISNDGRYFLVSSAATDIISGTSGYQVFRIDSNDRSAILISSTDGTAANQANTNVTRAKFINGNGNKILFISDATNLDADQNGVSQLYYVDLEVSATPTIISRSPDAPFNVADAAVSMREQQIITDSNIILLASDADNIQGATPTTQILSLDLSNNNMIIGSSIATPSFTISDSYLSIYALDYTGRYLTFSGKPSSFFPTIDTTYNQIYVKDFLEGSVTLVSTSDGTIAGALPGNSSLLGIDSGIGKVIYFNDKLDETWNTDGSALISYDMKTKTNELIFKGKNLTRSFYYGAQEHGDISKDGRYITFLMQGYQYVPDSSVFTAQIYFRDLETGESYVVTSSDGDHENGFGGSHNYPRISEDGRFISFMSNSTEIVAGTSGNKIYLWDRETKSIELISSLDGTSANQSDGGCDYDTSVSADGNLVAFTCVATNFTAGVPVGVNQVYVKNRQTGTITLVSSPDGTGANAGDRTSYNPVLSGNGRYIVFISNADNFMGNLDNDQIYRKDLQTGSLELVSSIDGTSGTAAANPNTWLLDTDHTGNLVAFTADSSLYPSFTPGLNYISYVKNMQDQSLKVVNSLDGTEAGLVDSCVVNSISPNGRYVAMFFCDDTDYSDSGWWPVLVYDLLEDQMYWPSSMDNKPEHNGNGNMTYPMVTDDGDVLYYFEGDNLTINSGNQQVLSLKGEPIPASP